MFRDENELAERKVKNRYERLNAKNEQKHSRLNGVQRIDIDIINTPSVHGSSSDVNFDEQIILRSDLSTRTIRLSLTSPIEDQAISFFMGLHMIPPILVTPLGKDQSDYLPGLLKASKRNSTLQRAITAAGLAALANAFKSKEIMKKAQKEYVSALALTNKALESTNAIKKDSTLVSVMLLGMYENFTHQGKDSVRARAEHISGACALIVLRGKNQFNSDNGIRLFTQIYSTAFMVALESGTDISLALIDMWEVRVQGPAKNALGKACKLCSHN